MEKTICTSIASLMLHLISTESNFCADVAKYTINCWRTLKLFQSSAWQDISSMISLSKFILAEGSMNGSRPIALSQAPNLWFRMGRPRITLCVKKRHDDGKQHANAKHRFHSRMAIGERYCSQWLHKIQHPFRISTFPGLNEYESYHKSRLK